MLLMRQAAALILPGTDLCTRTAGKWPPGKLKPNSDALDFEIVRRQPSARPKGWNQPDKCKWLREHGDGVAAGIPAALNVKLTTETSEARYPAFFFPFCCTR
jgi:hypothetical protein